jgi:hypothetical protein
MEGECGACKLKFELENESIAAEVGKIREAAKERQRKGGEEKGCQTIDKPNAAKDASLRTDTARAKMAGTNRQYIHDADTLAAVYSGTLHKSWSDDQRKMFAAAWQRANPKKRGPKSKGDNSCNLAGNSEAAEDAAKKFGVSTRGVYQAAVVLEEGCPQLQQAVRDGRVNVRCLTSRARASRNVLVPIQKRPPPHQSP